MTTVAINRDTLDGLFDNQRRLDDLFDSIFDEDEFFIKSTPYTAQTESYIPTYEVERGTSTGGFDFKELLLSIRQNQFSYLLPIIIEIAAMYMVLKNLM